MKLSTTENIRSLEEELDPDPEEIMSAYNLEDFKPGRNYTHLSILLLLDRRQDLENKLDKRLYYFQPKDKLYGSIYSFENNQPTCMLFKSYQLLH